MFGLGSQVHSSGGSQAWSIPTIFPHIGSCADDICLIRSTFTEAFNHHPGQSLLFTRDLRNWDVRQSTGSGVTYGLGSQVSENLPGFVVLSSGRGTSGGSMNWTEWFPSLELSGGCPSVGRWISDSLPVESAGVSARKPSAPALDLIRQLNQERAEVAGDTAISSPHSLL